MVNPIIEKHNSEIVTIEKEIAFAFDNFECYQDDDQLRLVVALPKCLDMQKVSLAVQTPIMYGLLHFFIKRCNAPGNHSGVASLLVANNIIVSRLVNDDLFRKNLIVTLTPKRETLILEYLKCQGLPGVTKLTSQDQIFLVVNGKTADYVIGGLLIDYNLEAKDYFEKHQTNQWATRSRMDRTADILKKLTSRWPEANCMEVFRAFHKAGDSKNIESMAMIVPGVKKYLVMK